MWFSITHMGRTRARVHVKRIWFCQGGGRSHVNRISCLHSWSPPCIRVSAIDKKPKHVVLLLCHYGPFCSRGCQKRHRLDTWQTVQQSCEAIGSRTVQLCPLWSWSRFLFMYTIWLWWICWFGSIDPIAESGSPIIAAICVTDAIIGISTAKFFKFLLQFNPFL